MNESVRRRCCNKRGKPCEKRRIKLSFESFEMNYLSQAKCRLLDCSFLLWMLLVDLSLSQYIHSLFVACKQTVGHRQEEKGEPVQCSVSALFQGPFCRIIKSQLSSETRPSPLACEGQGQGGQFLNVMSDFFSAFHLLLTYYKMFLL